ncbi:MAG: J domain-containing protein [Caldilineaceae bacterium]
MDYKDYYSILGVSRSADEKELRRAFRKLARQHHPDVNPNNPEAEQRFKEINEAYTVLSDPEKRQLYDRFGAQWEEYQRAQAAGINPEEFARRGQAAGPGGARAYTRTMTPEEFAEIFGSTGGFGGFQGGRRAANEEGFSDFFETLFGGGQRARTGRERVRRGRDIEATVQLTLEEAFHGATRLLQRENGQRLEAQIPRGVRTGSRIRLGGEGETGSNSATAGDLYLNVEVLPHARFTREWDDLRLSLPVDLYTIVLGGEVQVPTLEQPVLLKIPPGTQNGKAFRLRNLGMPHLRNPDERGDLYVEVDVQVPTRLTAAQRQLFEQLRALSRPGATTQA